jgi:tetratricopeptide (TPR) repeat protein
MRVTRSLLAGALSCLAIGALAQAVQAPPTFGKPVLPPPVVQPNAQQSTSAAIGMQGAQNILNQIEGTPQITKRQVSNVVDSDVMRGYTALQQNQFTQAREAYSQALSRQPTQRDALLGIAYAHFALGDNSQATSTLRRLLELYPRDSDALSALFLIAGGDPQEQESRLKQFLERSERPAGLHYALGVLYFEQSRFAEAERAFERAFAMEPEQPDYAFNLAVSLDRLGRIKEAARQYVTALNLANQNSSVFSRDVARARVRALTTPVKP